VKKPHRYKPGTVALREIRRYQVSSKNLFVFSFSWNVGTFTNHGAWFGLFVLEIDRTLDPQTSLPSKFHPKKKKRKQAC
jgi:hypothetical protein